MKTPRKYKVEFVRSGVTYSPEYVATINGAMKKATSKGWGSGDQIDLRPHSARISERVEGTGGRETVWEEVAVVSKGGLRIQRPGERPSVIEARARIAAANATIEEAVLTEAALTGWLL